MNILLHNMLSATEILRIMLFLIENLLNKAWIWRLYQTYTRKYVFPQIPLLNFQPGERLIPANQAHVNSP